MAAQERELHTKTADELEMIRKLTETCKKLKAEKGALEVKCILFLFYLIRFLCHVENVCLSLWIESSNSHVIFCSMMIGYTKIIKCPLILSLMC
jgi:hypothetical protein